MKKILPIFLLVTGYWSLVTANAADVTPSRSFSAARNAAATTTSARDNLEAAVRTVGRNARVSAAGINASAAARRAGVSLRPSTAEVGGRATIGNTGLQTGSNIDNSARAVQSRAASSETITAAKDRLEQTADLNASCQTQYNDCMDQFCSVIDTNQKRCSCSANLSRYTRVEAAVKDANAQLNDVAQRIRYIGLSADEIRAIMTATEAEEALTGQTDNTASRNMLEAIEKLIQNPTAGTSGVATSDFGLDINFDFSTDPSNMFNLDFLGTNSSSFSNLRGTELYDAAKRRCATILNQCVAAGAASQQITGNYDLAIDKDCIAYEVGLSKMNDSLRNNVRTADQMLKKARLAVLENKNEYDARGCIAALNNCMVDDMVCGAGYEKCVDPTKRYIDENGKVVLGQNISDITAFMQNYNNAAITEDFIRNSQNINMNDIGTCKTNNGGQCLVKYLTTKIGTGKTPRDGGLCRAVLDRCQAYTYTDNSEGYNPYNNIVVNYIQRAMVNINAAQNKIISDYASSCMVDIATCYNQQVSQVTAWSAAASTSSVYNVMRGACRNVALTCAYAVFANNTQNLCTDEASCIEEISKVFYQSLLCPDNSTYQTTAVTSVGNQGTTGYVNERCRCNSGFVIWGGACTRICGAGTQRNQLTGNCEPCPNGMTSNDGSTQDSKCQ